MPAAIESREEFTKSQGKAKGNKAYWETELTASKKRLRRWHKLADRIDNRYVDRQKDEDGRVLNKNRAGTSLNLFHSNVTTLKSMLYGNLPTVDVSRKFADSQDDAARVAAEMMERVLNADLSDNAEDYDTVLRSCLLDRLVPGLGCAKVRYEVETEQVPELGGPDWLSPKMVEQVTDEAAPVEYFHWRDVLWSWGRSFHDLQWIAYRTYLDKDELTKRFSEDIAKQAEFKQQETNTKEGDDHLADQESPWQKAEVWEIWDKTKKQVVYLVKGCEKIAETKPDPLKLSNFYPSPAFFMANPTTTLYTPTPDYYLSEDLYNEIDVLQTRISTLTSAVKAVGVYDASAEGVQRIFTEGTDNTLIPVENWALFAEKGGLAGQIDWVPIDDIVNALNKLIETRDQTISLLQQTSGMADVMRGSLDNQYEGVGQSQIKAKFGSVRIQAMQDDFAKFASELMQIKAEVIAIHFDPQRIVQASNMSASMDAELIPQAIQLLKQPKIARLRVTIRPESVAMTDFAELQNERVGFMNALSTFLQSAAPMIEAKPESEPYLLSMLQWGLSGFKGSSEIEGVMDRAIDASLKAAKAAEGQQKQDPAAAMEQAKQQGEMQKIQAKAQADMQIRAQDLQADMETDMRRHQQKMEEIHATMQSTLATIQAKAAADIEVELVQTQANMAQTEGDARAEIDKDATNMAMELNKSAQEHQQELEGKLVDHQLDATAALRDSKLKIKEAKTNADNSISTDTTTGQPDKSSR